MCGGTLNTCTVGTFQDETDTGTTWNWSCTNGSHVTPCPKAKPNPTTPVISGPLECTANQSCTYTFAPGADSGVGNQIQYEIDWDNNGVPDHYSPLRPSTGLPTYARGNDWSTTGNKTFRARVATSPDGRTSPWTSFTVNVVPAPVPASCGAAQHVCGVGTLSDIPDTATTFQWNCLGLYGGAPASCTLPKPNPTHPVISGPLSCVRDESCTYTFSPGNDNAVGNQIQYEIDWDNNGTIDQWSPLRVASGLPAFSQNNDWPSTGMKTFRARVATIPDGRTSTWVSYTVTVIPPYIEAICGTTQGTCVKGSPSSVDVFPLEWRWTCYGSGGGDDDSCMKERDVAILHVTPTGHSYSGFALGDPAWDQSFTVTNIGSSISKLSGTLSGIQAPWSVHSGGTFTELKKGDAPHLITVRFNPSAVGSYNSGGWMPQPVITSNGGSQVISLGGSAVEKVTLSDTVLDFGEVPRTRTAYKTVTIKNNSQQFSATVPPLSFPAPFFCVTECAGKILSRGAEMTVRVGFSPTEERVYEDTDTLMVILGRPPVTLQLRGTGIQPVFKIEER